MQPSFNGDKSIYHCFILDTFGLKCVDTYNIDKILNRNCIYLVSLIRCMEKFIELYITLLSTGIRCNDGHGYKHFKWKLDVNEIEFC